MNQQKRQQILSILKQIKLPRDLSERHIEALNDARYYVLLEYDYANTNTVTYAEKIHCYSELSGLARCFLSRSYAEIKWAHDGEIYNYGDSFWTGKWNF